MTSHPFASIETLLARPEADGVMLTMVLPDSPFAAAGLAAGDVIVRIDDVEGAPARREFQASLQPAPGQPGTRRFEAVSPGGARKTAEVALPGRGVSACQVTAGQAAWHPELADDAEPDFSALTDGAEICLRNSLGEVRAGHEVLRLSRRGDLLDVEILFRLGGDDGQGGGWTYATRATATLRLEAGLPAVATSFREDDRLVGDVRLDGDDWRGEAQDPDGSQHAVRVPATADFCPGYVSTLLPLTMPLREGARLTYCAAGDGRPVPLGRDRFECLGRETVSVDGQEVEAWCFVLRHYGLESYGGDERFHVTDDRRLVRIDWGPNYGGCWSELVPRERLNDGVPERAHFRG